MGDQEVAQFLECFRSYKTSVSTKFSIDEFASALTFQEHGPLLINATGGLMRNPYSWTKQANMLILESTWEDLVAVSL